MIFRPSPGNNKDILLFINTIVPNKIILENLGAGITKCNVKEDEGIT